MFSVSDFRSYQSSVASSYPHATGLFQNLGVDARMLCYSAGAKGLPRFLFSVPKSGT